MIYIDLFLNGDKDLFMFSFIYSQLKVADIKHLINICQVQMRTLYTIIFTNKNNLCTCFQKCITEM